MQRTSAHTIIIAATLVVALLLRLAAGAWWQSRLAQGQRFQFGDSESYWVLAQTIVRGEPYEYGEGMRVFRTPGYPVLLAGLFFLVGDDPSVMWARALSAALGTLSVGGVMWMAGQLFDARTSLTAGVMSTLYPGAIGASTFVLSEAPFCPLMLLQLICWAAAIRAARGWRRILWAGLGGLAAGGATLVRPSWLAFTPFAALIATLACRERRRHAWLGLTMMAALVVAMLPWWIRNYRITGKPILTTLQVGASLYDGLNPRATGASDFWFVGPFRREQERADAADPATKVGTFEYRLDQRMRRAAIAWARENWPRSMQLVWIKLARMWSPWPHAADMQSWTFRLVMSVGYVPVVLLGGLGAVIFWRRGWPYVLCLLPGAYLTLLHVIFVSSIRYREPAMLAVIVLAAGAVTQGWRANPLGDQEEATELPRNHRSASAHAS